MPIYRASHDDVFAKIAELEAAGETVVSVSHSDGGVYIATNVKPKVGRPAKRQAPGDIETRA